MEAALSAQSHETASDSWHPARRPKTDQPQDVNRKQTDQSSPAPLHSADNKHERRPTKEPFDELKDAGQPENRNSLSNNKDDQNTTSVDWMAPSDTRVETSDLPHVVDEQTAYIGKQEPRPSEGMLGDSWEDAGASTSLPDSYSQSGPSGDSLSPDLFQESVDAHTESANPVAPAAEPNHVESTAEGKEEMVKAWDLELDHAGDHRPGDISRTNSFPRVPPLQQMVFNPPHSLSHSQAETIMEEDDSAMSIDRQSLSKSPLASILNDDTLQQPFESTRDEDVDFFAHINPVQAADESVHGDEQSRFEEGLPLMPSQSLENSPTEDLVHSAAVRKNGDSSDHDDRSFAERSLPLLDDISTFRPQALDRKSTIQVLDSFHYAPHSTTHGEPHSAEESPLLANMTGEDIAVSASTLKSPLVAEQQMNKTEAQPNDEDLAEMWKAALGDDDLLDDNELSLDPSSFFEDDGEGFLEGNEDQAEIRMQGTTSPRAPGPIYGSGSDGSIHSMGQINARQSSSHSKELLASGSQSFTASHTYGSVDGNRSPAHQPFHISSGLTHPASSPDAFVGASKEYNHAAQTATSRPSMPPSTQSFADKSKGGYTSPYDLPIDVTRPKKRTPYQQLHPSSDAKVIPARPPPPRSSSMFTGGLATLRADPQDSRLPGAVSSAPIGKIIPPPLKNSPSLSAFFEELPSSKPRPSSSMGRVALPTSEPTPPPAMSVQRDQSRQVAMTQQRSSGSPSQQYQLLPPERMSLFANSSQSEPAIQPVPMVNTRYSPAPVQQSNIPPPRTRYAASPSNVGRSVPSQTLSFQPRTSSPLAQNSLLPQERNHASVSEQSWSPSNGKHTVTAQDSLSSKTVAGHQSTTLMERNSKHNENIGRTENDLHFRDSPPPPTHYAPLSNSPSDSSYAMNTPEADYTSSDGSASLQQPQEPPMDAYGASSRRPPSRTSQSQSPGVERYKPELPQGMHDQYQRPGSVNNHVPLPLAETRPQVTQTRQREGAVSRDINYIKPSDGREMDYLERWKGCPIFSFGFGGTIVTSFPKQVPRYAAGQSTPMIKCSPGEVKIRDDKILPLDEDIAAFPGPLKSKNKRKDVLDWLQNKIAHLESSGFDQTSSATLPDPRRRHEEKTMLWKIVRVLVEHDGAIDGKASAENAIRLILSPELTVGDSASLSPQAIDSQLLGISRSGGSRSFPDPVKPEVVEDLRKLLLHGEREKAVWHAVDNRLWAHAMLLASTLEKNLWKQVSQEFVRQEVKTFGNNTESLAALYQIFAGNWEESMDELVPPSARAGLQMVSKNAATGPTKNALDGLDRWRETLTLILSNRSVDDGRALVSLGQLLAGYGRTEAAHICYIFAKSPGLFGGPDDSQVSVTLLGADHLQQPFDYARDLDSILLTEVYDFARTVLAPSSTSTVSPHLQSYKLYHAMILAEYGYKIEAQQYCEMITSALNSTTKRSPYYHNILIGALENLVDKLRQAPRDNSGSWISRPSIDKVSGSIWAKFNQYVAGDESDAASTGSGKAQEQDVGPFARVAGDSPNLSRTPSSSDIYSTNAPGLGVSPIAPMSSLSNSRYAPAGLYTPRSSLEQPSNASQEFQRPIQAQGDSLRPGTAPHQYQPRPMSSTGSYPEAHKPTSQPSSYFSRTESYLSTQPSMPECMPIPTSEELPSSLYHQNSHQPTPPLEPDPSREQYQPLLEPESAGGRQPSPMNFESSSYKYDAHSTSDYEPPPMNTYDPPAYDPYVPQAGESPVEEKPKRKTFMDDTDDDAFEARAATLRKEEKARNDRMADEAFKRAAEADGMYQHALSP